MLAIKAENISKQYRLGQVGTGTLSHDLNRFYHKLVGKEDPYLKIGEANDRATKGESEYVWSLRDINFEIEQGDAVGIIGRNGAGKSTLLKLLSKVTKPTTGTIRSNGRIASLLEVGTGFHPEMTGRENVFLNGAILGMTRKEITRKFDEIVDFSGVERYIDTPVKRYSSGMYVRLAFAVAAHLESEILIVDEVLAVGDADFQKKCLGKMDDVSTGEGRTVLFVSHNLQSVAKLCKNGILLEKGHIKHVGLLDDIIDKYLVEGKNEKTNSYIAPKEIDKNLFFQSVETINSENTSISRFGFNEEITIKIKLFINQDITNIILGIGVLDKYGGRVCTFMKPLDALDLDRNKKEHTVEITIPKNIIAPNSYSLVVGLYIENAKIFDIVDDICNFKIYDTGTIFTNYEGLDYGYMIIDSKWQVK